MVFEGLLARFTVHAAKKEQKKEEAPPPPEEPADVVDYFQEARDHCQEDKHVAKMKNRLDRCNTRVTGTPGDTETCVEELMDYMHSLDHCAMHHKFFEKLR